MLVISDNCFCEYTTHGHCGVVAENDVVNDETLQNLQKQVVTAAKAGVPAKTIFKDGIVTHLPALLF